MRPSATVSVAVLALLAGGSCASAPESSWERFAGAWEDAWNDSGAFFGEQFFKMPGDDPYARPGGWAQQGDDAGRAASRLFLDSGDRSGERVPRSNPRRSENAARSFFDWVLDID